MGRDHSKTCRTCGEQSGGMDNVECACGDVARERVAAIAAGNGAAQAVAVLLDSIDRRLAELRAADHRADGAPTLADRVAALELRLAQIEACLDQQPPPPPPRRKR